MTETRAFYLEDLTVGQIFNSATHTVTAAEIKAFAAQFDPQPFHLDEAAAQTSLFAGLAASGWHTAGLSMSLLVKSLVIAEGMIGGAADIAWPQPTRPGDIMRVETEVVEIIPSRTRPNRGMVKIRSTTRNQRDEVLQTLAVKLVVPRRPG